MKDLPLSLLSRGCGRFVLSNRNRGRRDGRLDVCFTPQDYHIWKSQDSFLQLSNRGRLLVESESTLPKTYSTRRGPLLLYSQDLVTMETSYHSETRGRKQRVVRQYTHHVEQQLSTIKELTAAILSYSNNQFSSSRLGPPFFPPLHLPLAPDLHCPSTPPTQSTPEQSSPELLVQLNPQWFPSERHSEQLENHPEVKEEMQCSRKRVRLDLFLQIPRSSQTPSPQMEPQPWVHYVAMTPEEVLGDKLMSEMHSDMSQQHSEINHHGMEEELHHPNVICVHDTADAQDHEPTSDNVSYERPLSVTRHGRTGLLPPLTAEHSVGHGLCWEKTDRVRQIQGQLSYSSSVLTQPSRESHCIDEHHPQHLPPIAESCTVPDQVLQAQTQRDTQSKAERVGFKSQKNLNRLHQQPLVLPVLFPGKEEEINGKQRGGRGDKTGRQHLNKETLGQGGGGRLPSEKGSMILLEPGEDQPPPLGVMGCVPGRKGPGKQSSLAFLQSRLLDLKDPCESSEANRGVVRGILPLELRDLQSDKPAGSLILGPDGEIIQLSLYDSQDPSQGDGDTQDRALQVLSAEGERLPWVIVLQPEHAHTEKGVELNTNVPVGDVQFHQSLQKLLDLHRSSESDVGPPSSQPQPVAVKMRKRSGRTVAERWKVSKRDKNSVRMPPLRERVGKEEPNGGNTEEEDEDEELSSTGQTRHLSGLHEPGEKLQFKDSLSCNSPNESISPNETTEDAVDRKRKHAKRMGSEEAAITTGKGGRKTLSGAASDGQKISRIRKEGRRQREKAGSNTRSTRGHREEGRTNREATESQDQSALPSVQKRMTNRGGAGGEVKMKEENEAQEVVARQKEEAAGRRRRRGKLKHKELDVGNHEDPMEKDEVELYQETEEGSDLKSTKKPSATQRRHDRTKTNSEEDADTDTEHLSSYADKYSSVQSVSSIRSTATASQFNHRSRRRSAASSCEGTLPASAMGLTSSCGRLSSCSTVMVSEEQLMLNPVKPESSRIRKSQEEAAALHLAQRAERRRQEVERKRREREEEDRKQQQREQTEDRLKNELEEERRKRAEEIRLKKLIEEEETSKREEEEKERVRREQAQRERERRRQEEKRRQMERLQMMREEEEQKRRAEVERLRLEEERRKEEESKMLMEMDESERIEYLHRKELEEEDLRNKEEERKRTQEEAALQAAEEARLQTQLLARQMGLLQRQLAFKRGLLLEAGGLEKSQGISRPWIYSYFTLLQLLGLNATKTEPTTP